MRQHTTAPGGQALQRPSDVLQPPESRVYEIKIVRPTKCRAQNGTCDGIPGIIIPPWPAWVWKRKCSRLKNHHCKLQNLAPAASCSSSSSAASPSSIALPAKVKTGKCPLGLVNQKSPTQVPKKQCFPFSLWKFLGLVGGFLGWPTQVEN